MALDDDKQEMWYKIMDQQVSFTILAKPNAKRTALVAINDQGMVISLHAKPHQGEANKELINFLSGLLQLPKSQIILQRGEKGKHKQVIVPLTEKIKKLINYPGQFISAVK